MCYYFDGPMHMNMRPKPRPTMFPSVCMNGVNGIGRYWRLFTRAGPTLRRIRQLPKAPIWKGGPKILEKKGSRGKYIYI